MTFQFPSLSAVIKGILDTAKRFPLPLLSAIVGSGICIYIIGMKWDVQKDFDYLWKIVMCCGLGLNLFLSMSLISERRDHGAIQKYTAQIFGLLILTGYYFLLPEFRKMTITDGTRYALFTTGLHLLVAFSPFIARGEINGFWQFNKTLFLRFLLSALYSGVLYLGLALALIAIDQLFNVKIRGERYGQLWFFLAGIFNTWFFLSGVPEKFEELETSTDYPKGLKIFTQFVLLPLVTVYLLILYAYGVKIIIQWELPKGWVSYLVNAFSVFGILSLLLIWPIRNAEGNTWIKIFSRWFYRALFPLIILLFVAIGKRVAQYGITENRYFVLIVALWLVGIAIYFLLSKTKNIKYVPVSLCFIAFFSSFGPWSAFSISEKSQVHRLEKLLTEEKILVDGKIKKTTDTISAKSGRQIVSIVHYLDQHHGFDEIKLWFKENLDTVLAPKDSNDYVNKTEKILALMGVEDNYYDRYREEEEDTATVKNFYYNALDENQQAVSVAGFDYFLNFNQSFSEGDSYPYDKYYQIYLGTDSIFVKYSNEKKEFILTKNGKDVLQFDMCDFAKKIHTYKKANKKNQYDQQVPQDKMLFDAQNDSVKIRFRVRNISGTISNGETSITQVNGMLLLKFSSSPQNTMTNGSIEKH
ncbi:MAG: DUF4153 domain-containing protein [Bacteroidetes bacterium]|nr:DUF4153 domain-containing protein [Bacteroidota bacterium]